MNIVAILFLAAATFCCAIIGNGDNAIAGFCAALFFPLAFVLYFSPSIVAATRRRPGLEALVALNLFLGWTLIGWVICLVWALSLQPAMRRG